MSVSGVLLDLVSEVSLQTWLILVLVFLVAYNQVTKEPWKNLPPGPLALPVVGSLPFLGVDIREPLVNMAKKYGDVFTVYMGNQRVVVLNGYEAIKEAFAKYGHAFSGRPPIFVVTEITKGYGIAFSQGSFWKEQRRHALRVLRDFGVGRTVLEDRILEEVGFFIEAARLETGHPYYPKPLIQKSVSNVISAVTFGNRFDYEDSKFKTYLQIMNESSEIIGNSGLLTVFPFLRCLPGDFFHYKRLMKSVEYMDSEHQRLINEHKQNLDEDGEPRDFIDAYLQSMKNEQHNDKTTFSEYQLVRTIADLFNAGTETTSTTLTWSLVYMTLHPEIQDKIHTEIDCVIQKGESPRMHHRTRLPYTEASILEIQRISEIVPLGVPHATTEDVTFRGYHIPSGTMIMANMYSVSADPKIWPEPEKFKPERFLDQSGKLCKRDEFIPFSVGKRVCLGEALAKMELFLYFVSMLQNFRFRLAPGHPVPDTKGTLSITNIPKPFKIIIENRHSL